MSSYTGIKYNKLNQNSSNSTTSSSSKSTAGKTLQSKTRLTIPANCDIDEFEPLDRLDESDELIDSDDNMTTKFMGTENAIASDSVLFFSATERT